MDRRRITIDAEPVDLVFDDLYGAGVAEVFEPEMTAVVNRSGEPSAMALDVGANIGCTAILLAQHSTHVHAFEAVPSTCAVLERNVATNGRGRITVHGFGLGDEAGEVMYTRRTSDRSGSFVDTTGNELVDHVSEVGEIRTLDSMIDEFDSRIGLVKIDVEGFELHVLRGARELLAAHAPTVVLEMNHYCLNVFQRTSIPDFLDELRAIFPTLVAIDRNTFHAVDLHDPSPAYFAVHEHITGSNYMTLVGSPSGATLR